MADAADHDPDSRRVTEARSRAEARAERQRAWLRPFGWVIAITVAYGAASSHPKPALHGSGLGVSAALVVYLATLIGAMRPRFIELDLRLQAVVIGLMGAAGIALSAQSHGSTGLAASAAVFVGGIRLPTRLGLPISAAITAGLAIAIAVGGQSAASVVATVLLCVTLGLVGWFLKQARASQEQTELLLAQLEDARDAQAEAAALAERTRIAGDLHDVLAHSLSGAAIQLQTARMMGEKTGADAGVRAAIERASELVKDGLADARRAVGALRGDEQPGVEQLEALVASFRDDMHVHARLVVEGEPRRLDRDAGSAIYRGAQEALTNVARYAPGAETTVRLRWHAGGVQLRVENERPASTNGLTGVGGGRGLEGMRERVERAGGRMEAGPTDDGWCVRLEVPA